MASDSDRTADDGLEQIREHNSEVCNEVQSLDQIGTKWRLRVLHHLFDGAEHRFNELKRASGASSYTLSNVLDSLEEDAIINRRVKTESPIATFYSLTEKGRALEPAFDALHEWNEEWGDAPSQSQDN